MIEKYECPDCGKNIEWDDQREDQYIICPHCDSKLRSPSAATFSAGVMIGDYEIIKRLGIGGMGEVYLAEQKSMMRPVALKVLQQSLVENQSYLDRFYREVRTLAQIEHPNVVKAIETGYDEEQKICYFSMRYIEGEDLKKRLDKEGKIPEEDALNVIMHVALALQFVWDKYKLIHRDIKPANIIVTDDGEVKLMDLGISKSMMENARADLTMAGMMVGSPYYVSPEQAKAEKNLDFRADMYSLGASFYHMLTGQLPFDNENTMAIIASHLTDPVPDPKKLIPEISENSVKIIKKMMEKAKNDRYSSWDDALNDIEEAINSLASVDVGKTTSLQPAVVLRSIQSTGQLPSAVQPAATVKNLASVKQNMAKAELLKTLKDGVLGRVLGNLYIRFVVLVMLLFLTFVAFFSVIKKSIKEGRDREAKGKMNSALNYISTMPKNNKGFREAYRLLMEVKKSGSPKYVILADGEIDKLKHNASKAREQAKMDIENNVLIDLKTKAYDLENKGDFSGALRLWEDYAIKGAFRKELKNEIKIAIGILQDKIAENSTEDGGID